MANITVNIMASIMNMKIIINYGYEGGTFNICAAFIESGRKDIL